MAGRAQGLKPFPFGAVAARVNSCPDTVRGGDRVWGKDWRSPPSAKTGQVWATRQIRGTRFDPDALRAYPMSPTAGTWGTRRVASAGSVGALVRGCCLRGREWVNRCRARIAGVEALGVSRASGLRSLRASAHGLRQQGRRFSTPSCQNRARWGPRFAPSIAAPIRLGVLTTPRSGQAQRSRCPNTVRGGDRVWGEIGGLPHLPKPGRAIRLPFTSLRVAQARLWGTRQVRRWKEPTFVHRFGSGRPLLHPTVPKPGTVGIPGARPIPLRGILRLRAGE